MNSDKCLLFKDVTVHFLYYGILKTEIDTKNWEDDSNVEKDILFRRLFHPRYFEAIKDMRMATFQPLRIEGIAEDSFRSILWPKGSIEKSIFEQFIEEKRDILSNKDLQIKAWIYGGRGIVFCMTLQLDGEYTAEHLLALTNALSDFNGKLILAKFGELTLEDILRKILANSISKEENAFELYEKFTVIHPYSLSPPFDNSEDYFQEPYAQELFAVAIRRELQFRDIKKAIIEKTQKNLANYDTDIVILNYHNMFCYLNSQLSIDFYLGIVRTVKTFETLIHFYNSALFRELPKELPKNLKELREIAEKLEKLKIEVDRFLSTYEMLTSMAATRARLFLEACIEIFGIKKLTASLLDNLKDIEDLLSKRYNLELQKKLQWISIILAILTVVITLFEIIGIDRLISWLKMILMPFH